MKRAQWIPGAVLVGALGVAAAACNSITGLNDYEKVDCVGACGDAGLDAPSETAPDVLDDVAPDVVSDVADAGPDVDAFLESGTDADADVVADAPNDVNYDASEVGAISRTLRWARWRMPHEHIPDAAVPEGGPTFGPTSSLGYEFVEAGVNYFKDLETEVLWTYTYGPMKLGQANTHCTGLVSAPLKARLPTRIELVSLLEPSLNPPHSDTLNDTAADEYWTMSNAPNRDLTPEPEFWVVDFGDGEVRTVTVNGTKEAYVRCVIDQP